MNKKKIQRYLLCKRKLSAMELSEMCMQIEAMCGAGIPIGTAMEILQKGAVDTRIKRIYQQLHKALMEGALLSEAMEHMEQFPDFMIHMFRTAEITGQMERTAHKLARYFQKKYRLENQIQGALLYPRILMMVLICMILFILWVIIPTISPLLVELELPMMTRVLLFIGSMTRATWYGIGFLAIAGIVFMKYISSRKRVRFYLDYMKLSMPVTGRYWRIICTARFTRTLNDMYGNGISLVDGLKFAGKMAENMYLEHQINEAIREMKGGTLMSAAMERINGLDSKLSPIVFVGEETGKLNGMLDQIADNYEHEAESVIGRVASMVEPAMILIMGLAVGVILISIMYPLTSMYGNVK